MTRSKLMTKKRSRKVPDVKKAAAHDVEPKQTDAGAARSAGLSQFALAGRPSAADFVKVYGTKKAIGWTWIQREKAGVSAADFQKVLASK